MLALTNFQNMAASYLRVSLFFVLALLLLWLPQRQFEQVEFRLLFNSSEPIQVSVAYGDGEDHFRFQNEDVQTREVEDGVQSVSGFLPPIKLKALRFTTAPIGEIGKISKVELRANGQSIVIDEFDTLLLSEISFSQEELLSLHQRSLYGFPPFGLLYFFAVFVAILLELLFCFVAGFDFKKSSNRSLLFKGSVVFLAVLAGSLLFGRPSYRPISIKIKGAFDDAALPQKLTFQIDSGEGFNQLERLNVVLARELAKLRIVNVTPEDASRKGREVHFISGNFDGAEFASSSFTRNAEVLLHNGHYLLPDKESDVHFESGFSSAKLTFINHPFSGVVGLGFGDSIFDEIDLFSEGESFVSYDYIVSRAITDSSFLVDIPNSPDNLSLRQLRISATPELLGRLHEIELSTPGRKSLKLDLVKDSGGKTLISNELPKGWNSSKSGFQWLSSVVLALFCSLVFVALSSGVRIRLSSFLPFFALFVPLLTIYLLYFVAYYPGSMTHDSFESYSQMLGETQRNYQPFFYLFYLRLLSGFGHGVAGVGLIQVLITTFLMSAIFYYAFREGCPKVMLAVAYLYALLSPVIGLYSITVWKDVPYALILLTVAFLIYLSRRRKISIESGARLKAFSPILFVLVVFAAGLRPPALLVLGIVTFGFLLTGALRKREVFNLFAITSGLFALANYGFGYAIGVHENTNYQKLWSIPSIVLAAHLTEAIDVPSTLANPPLAKFVELEDLKNEKVSVLFTPRFNPFLSFKEQSNLSKQVIEAATPLFSSLLWETLDRIWLTLSGQGYRWDNGWFRNRTWLFWKQSSTYYPVDFADRGAWSGSLLRFRSYVDKALPTSESSTWGSIGFNAVFQFSFLFLCCLLFKWFPATALFSGVILAPLMPFFILVPTLEFRYLYPIYLGGIFAPLLLALEVRGVRKS